MSWTVEPKPERIEVETAKTRDKRVLEATFAYIRYMRDNTAPGMHIRVGLTRKVGDTKMRAAVSLELEGRQLMLVDDEAEDVAQLIEDSLRETRKEYPKAKLEDFTDMVEVLRQAVVMAQWELKKILQKN